MLPVYADSVAPIVEAGLHTLVEADQQLTPEISLVPTHGHSPGHVSVRISSKGEEALITGDWAHHPCQLAHPEWASTADYDAKAAEVTRRRMLAELADRPVLVIGTHFAGPTAGRVKRDGNAYRLDV
jgi:glyoxylase-like metal-dependent hydrolase (beta-lactamase superfamily II)